MSNLPTLTDAQRTELTDSRSPFSAEDRVVVAMCFISCGGEQAKAAARATRVLGKDIPAGTLRQWLRRTWWPQALELGRGMLQQELAHKYTRLLLETEKEILDRVKNGEMKAINGELIRVPASLRDLVGAHAVMSDKRAMLYGEPTSRKEDSGMALAHKLVGLLQKQGERQIKDMREPIEGEYTEVATPQTDSDEVLETPDGASPQEP